MKIDSTTQQIRLTPSELVALKKIMKTALKTTELKQGSCVYTDLVSIHTKVHMAAKKAEETLLDEALMP